MFLAEFSLHLHRFDHQASPACGVSRASKQSFCGRKKKQNKKTHLPGICYYSDAFSPEILLKPPLSLPKLHVFMIDVYFVVKSSCIICRFFPATLF